MRERDGGGEDFVEFGVRGGGRGGRWDGESVDFDFGFVSCGEVDEASVFGELSTLSVGGLNAPRMVYLQRGNQENDPSPE